jgi:hypothetical protein
VIEKVGHDRRATENMIVSDDVSDLIEINIRKSSVIVKHPAYSKKHNRDSSLDAEQSPSGKW